MMTERVKRLGDYLFNSGAIHQQTSFCTASVPAALTCTCHRVPHNKSLVGSL